MRSVVVPPGHADYVGRQPVTVAISSARRIRAASRPFFADGSVRHIDYAVDQTIFLNLGKHRRRPKVWAEF